MSNTLLNVFLSLHALLIVAAVLSYGLRFLNHKRILTLAAKDELTLNHFLIFAVMILPLVTFHSFQQFQFKPLTKTYISSTYKEFDLLTKTNTSEKILLSEQNNTLSISSETIQNILLLFMFASMAFTFLKAMKEMRILRTIIGNAFIHRRIGRVHIAYSGDVSVPFSFRLMRSAWVIIPTAFLENAGKAHMSILHELQHHRQHDTSWLYLYQLTKAFLGINPAVNMWIKLMSEIQELKVDENLLDQGKVEPSEYARCLIEVAENAVRENGHLACAAGFAFFQNRHQLSRRVESMFTKKVTNQLSLIIVGGFLFVSMTAMSLASGNFIGSRSISMSEAEKMLAVAKKDSKFPIELNDLVLEQLNRYLGTAQGRAFMKKSLQRMETYRSSIESQMKTYSYEVPMELMAVPLIESGYQNLPETSNRVKSAGLWQFIRGTAKVYGLRVDKNVDERLDVELSTDAALRYILSNQLRFKDWLLAMHAYNMGEGNVQKAIDKVGSRNVWDLIRAGHEGDKSYVAKLEAAILIMKNPESLN